jgi:hypothetical protein
MTAATGRSNTAAGGGRRKKFCDEEAVVSRDHNAIEHKCLQNRQ